MPFGHKPERFSKAYITKIVNQVDWVCKLTSLSEWAFLHQDFRPTLSGATETDFIYCDPPYAGRHTDYFNSWNRTDEKSLYQCLKASKARFILSTWHSNEHRENQAILTLWSEFNVITREHFYHVGANESNRKPIWKHLSLILNRQQLMQQKTPIVLEIMVKAASSRTFLKNRILIAFQIKSR